MEKFWEGGLTVLGGNRKKFWREGKKFWEGM